MVVTIRMLREIYCSVMLQHEYSVLFQQLVFENQINENVIMLTVVRRVGEDEVVFCLMHRQKPENIRLYYRSLIHIQLVGCLADKSNAVLVFVDGGHSWAAS